MTVIRKATCEEKKKYLTYERAKFSCQRLKRYAGGKKGRLIVYHCRFCNYWHIGSKLKSNKSKKVWWERSLYQQRIAPRLLIGSFIEKGDRIKL